MIGKKRLGKRVFAAALAAATVVTMLPSNGLESVAADTTWTDTGLVVNGDFETAVDSDGNLLGWGGYKDGKFSVKKDEWAKNNTTTWLDIKYTSTGEASLTQTIANLGAGTYKVTLEQSGKESTASGLSLSVTVGEADTASAITELPATTAWDAWTTVETSEFTIEDTSDITITLAGTLEGTYWGDIDNVKLLKKTDSGSDDSDKKTEKNWYDPQLITNGAFTTNLNGWTDTTVTDNETWKYGSGVDNGYYCIWENKSSEAQDFSLSQDVTLPAGTYKLSAKATGSAKAANLQMKAGDLASASIDCESWSDTWTTYETGEFTVTKETTITVSFTGSTPAGNKGIGIDDVTLYAVDEGYRVVVTADSDVTQVEAGSTVKLTAKVTLDGNEIKDLKSAGLYLWWYADKWLDGHSDGKTDITQSDSTGLTLTQNVTLNEVGSYYIVAKLQDSNYKDIGALTSADLTAVEAENLYETENEDIVVKKVSGLSDDFAMGVDISSIMSEFASGVTYKDFDGSTIDNITDFCKLLKESGVTHVRVRVWNNPYDKDGNGYGGGNNDVATAKKIADACETAGLSMLVDFHCSDFWTDPSKQMVPKAWEGYTLSQKKEALSKFISESLETIDPNKNTVTMVQVGNETTSGFIGETNTTNMCTLFSAGVDAVHAWKSDVKAVIHVESPHKSSVTKWAKLLDTNKVDYDVLATSYYPYWHGTLDNLTSELKTVKDTYGKEAMVAETSYAYTLDDTDGWDNTVRVGNNDDAADANQPFSVQGQATSIRNIIEAVNNAGGIGVFYWEPAWITVGDTTGLEGDALSTQTAENKAKWEKYGSGWASSYASDYDPNDAGKWYGGSAVDNQAMFAADGTPLASLKVWSLVKTGASKTTTSVEGLDSVSESVAVGTKVTLPETVNVTYSSGTNSNEVVAEKVVWESTADTSKTGTFTIKGTVTFSKDITGGTYKGMTNTSCTYTLTVTPENLITDADDAGFEKADNLSKTENGIIDNVSSTKDDAKSGNACAHWWNGGSDAVENAITYNKAISLAAGAYTFECYAQGLSGDKVYVAVVDLNENVIATGELTELEGWKVWKQPSVSFTLNKTTEVTLKIGIVSQSQGWGTIDDMYLYAVSTADESANPADPDESDKIVDNTDVDKDNTDKSATNDGTTSDETTTTTTSAKTVHAPKTSTTSAAKTGDQNNAYVWIMLMMAGIVVSANSLKRRNSR